MMAHLRYADLVVSDCAVVDERLNTITESFFALRRSRNGLMHNIMRNSYLGCCIALRRQLLDYALPFPANVPMHDRSEEHTSELQSLMRISYAVFCLKKKKRKKNTNMHKTRHKI